MQPVVMTKQGAVRGTVTEGEVVVFKGVSFAPDVSTTPLPASLPLFAGGLGLIGWLARRRNRKAAALLAAA